MAINPITKTPIQIDTSPMQSGQPDIPGPADYGPWLINGKLFCVLFNFGTTPGGTVPAFNVFMSADNGATWAPQDEAHAPQFGTQNFGGPWTYLDAANGILYFAYGSGFIVGPISFASFSFATSTYTLNVFP